MATTWSDANRQKAIKQLEREIHQLTPAKLKLFNKLFHLHERQLLNAGGTKANGPRRIFAKELAIRKAATEDKAYRATNIIAEN